MLVVFTVTVIGHGGFTVTVAEHVLELPVASVTVSVTALLPMLAVVNVFGETVTEAIEQLSVEPLLISEAAMLAVPF